MKAWMELIPVAAVAALGCAVWFSARTGGPAKGADEPAEEAEVDAGADEAALAKPAFPTGPLPAMRRPRILVVKGQRRMTLYDGRQAIRQYVVATGANEGDKVREGDLRTPEGQFYICLKNEKSDYHLSLGLSYPNVEDAQRGLRDKLITKAQHGEIVSAIRAGTAPPWKTPLGGEIMIHGCRNGRVGTHGCVAVENPEIDELFPVLPLGTPVEIRP